MALDAGLRRQLLEARERIIAQRDELIDRVQPDGAMGGFGKPDLRDVFAELEDELRQIDELLDSGNDCDGERDVS